MPIRLSQDLLQTFSKTELKHIQLFRRIATFLAFISIVLNFYVYISITYLSFIYKGTDVYFFDYYARLELIGITSVLVWISIVIASFCILLHVYLLMFTFNPHLTIIIKRKIQNVADLSDKIKYFKKYVFFRIMGQVLIMGTLIGELNYYPRNAELFYPYIGCNADSGICVISNTVFYTFVAFMTFFFIILIGIFIIILLINFKELALIKAILHPDVKRQERKIAKKNEKAQKRKLPVEERRKLKIEQLRTNYQKKVEEKIKNQNEKFSTMLQKEQYGKSGYKQVQKQDALKEKEKERKKPKKDEYDFT